MSGLDEGPDERQTGRLGVTFGMPLHSDDELVSVDLDRLDDTVAGECNWAKPLAQIGDRLMMVGWNGEGTPEVRRDFRALDGPYFVVDELAVEMETRIDSITQMLLQCSPEGDIQDLHATADAEDGLAPCDRTPDEGHLQFVPRNERSVVLRMRGLTIGTRVEIATTGDQDTVDDVDNVFNRPEGCLCRSEENCDPASFLDEVDILCEKGICRFVRPALV